MFMPVPHTCSDRIRTTNNMLGDCYAAAVVEQLSKKELMALDAAILYQDTPVTPNGNGNGHGTLSSLSNGGATIGAGGPADFDRKCSMPESIIVNEMNGGGMTTILPSGSARLNGATATSTTRK